MIVAAESGIGARGMLRFAAPPTREHAMSEQNRHEPDRPSRPSSAARTPRDADGHRALRRLDEAQESAHQAGGLPRRDGFPKDDRRSSARLTDRERSERWPLG